MVPEEAPEEPTVQPARLSLYAALDEPSTEERSNLFFDFDSLPAFEDVALDSEPGVEQLFSEDLDWTLGGSNWLGLHDEKRPRGAYYCQMFADDDPSASAALHVVRGKERLGLIIDPGAASALTGSDTLKALKEFAAKRGHGTKLCKSDATFTGISGSSDSAVAHASIPIFTGGKAMSFECDIMGGSGSNCPALLPLSSMIAKNMSLFSNVFANRDGVLLMHLEGPYGHEQPHLFPCTIRREWPLHTANGHRADH